MAALSGAERERELLSLWVRKEALLKAAGIGLAVEMDRFEAPADRVLALPGDVRTGSAVIRLFDGAEGCLAAVAAEIARAAGRERGCQHVSISVVAVYLQKKYNR